MAIFICLALTDRDAALSLWGFFFFNFYFELQDVLLRWSKFKLWCSTAAEFKVCMENTVIAHFGQQLSQPHRHVLLFYQQLASGPIHFSQTRVPYGPCPAYSSFELNPKQECDMVLLPLTLLWHRWFGCNILERLTSERKVQQQFWCFLWFSAVLQELRCTSTRRKRN